MTERESITQVHVIAADIDTLRSALQEYRSAVAGGVRTGSDGRVGIDAYLRPGQLERLRSQPVDIEVIADATGVGEERLAEVGRGNRFEDGSVPIELDEPSGGER